MHVASRRDDGGSVESRAESWKLTVRAKPPPLLTRTPDCFPIKSQARQPLGKPIGSLGEEERVWLRAICHPVGMKVSRILKAVCFGLATQVVASGVSIVLIGIGGWGPCGPGPGNYLSVAGALIQFPGWYLEEEILRWGTHPGVPGYAWDLPIIFGLQACLWTFVWLACLKWMVGRKERQSTRGSAESRHAVGR